MSEFCWPDGHGKIYCIPFNQLVDEDIGLYKADVEEREYPTKYCKTYQEKLDNESDVSCPTDTSEQTSSD